MTYFFASNFSLSHNLTHISSYSFCEISCAEKSFHAIVCNDAWVVVKKAAYRTAFFKYD